MAENEYLDSSIGRRWQPVAQAIQEGLSWDEIADRLEDSFCKTLREIQKELPLGEMIRAMDDPNEFKRVCMQVVGGDDVKDFLKQAVLENTGRQEQLEAFLMKAIDNCMYDIPYMATEIDGDISFKEVRSVLTNIRNNRLSEEIKRIASKFVDNPDYIPRRKSRGKRTLSKRERTRHMLDESLLARMKK